jgi:hypothetical protein
MLDRSPASPNDSPGLSKAITSEASREAHAKGQDIKGDLEREKLLLEIAELRRSPWSKPSIIVPICAALITLGLSQYLGVFDVERKRVELSSKEAEMRRQELREELAKLEGEKVDLLHEKKVLEERREGLGRDVGRLETEVQKLKMDTKVLRVAEQRAHSEAEKARRQLEHTRNVLARPDINFTTEVLIWEQKAMISMTNRGQGPAIVRTIRLYVDGRRMPEGPEDQPFDPTLSALGLAESWIRWYWTSRTLAPGEMTPVLMIEPGQFTKERAVKFETTTDQHFGMEVCYCSVLGDCYWATHQRPSVTASKCDIP